MRTAAAAEFLRRLNDLEDTAALLSGHPLALRKTVETLVEQGVWLKEDAVAFGRLFRVRDAVLHEDLPARTELRTALREVDRLASLIAGAARTHPLSPD